MEPLAEDVDGLPNLCGQEPLISEAITAGREYPVFIICACRESRS